MANHRSPPFLTGIMMQYPTKSIRVWFQDESRFGQKNRISKIWAECGSRPRMVQQNGFKSGYLYGAVDPLSGEHVGLVSSTCDSDFMQRHLNEISRLGGENNLVVLIVDGAGWHHSKDLKLPENVVLFFLPPYSPELNPVERLWLWIKSHHLSNCIYDDVTAILTKGMKAWKSLNPSIVKSICNATTILPSWYIASYQAARTNL